MIAKIRRRKYLVDKPFQLKYMGLVAVPLVSFLACLYYLIYYSVFYEMLIPEAIVATLLPAMKKVNLVLVAALPVLLVGIMRMALIYSNRIVGPIPRIEKELDKVLAGDYSVRIIARDKDELSAFIKKVNMVVEKMEKIRTI